MTASLSEVTGGAVSSVVSPVPPGQWRRFIDEAGRGLPTQAPEWSAAVTSSGHWRDCSRLYLLAGGRRLLVPMAAMGRGPAEVRQSWPAGWGYGGAMASDGVVTPDDVALVMRDLAVTNGLRTSVQPPPWDSAWDAAGPLASSQTPHLTHVLALDGGPDAIWSGYSTNVRRSIRRAQTSGLVIRRDDTGALWPAFDLLYRRSVQRWAQAAGRSQHLALLHSRLSEPPSRLRRLPSVPGGRCVVWAAFVDGEPAAAIVVLASPTSALYWRGAMDRDLAGRTHANALLHHLAITEATEAGARRYSFGPSDEASDLASYKAKFGAVPLRSAEYHLERLPITASIAAARRSYRSASSRVESLRSRVAR